MESNKAQLELNKLRLKVIGIYQDFQGYYYLVFNTSKIDNGIFVDAFRFTQMGVIQFEYGIDSSRGKYLKFPNNKNMMQMLEKPFEWVDFMDNFTKV